MLQRTFEFKKNEIEKVNEDVSVDVKENYVIYHIINDDTEVSVIEDFNRVSRLNIYLYIYSCNVY